MTNYEITQTDVIIPARSEIALMLTIMALLIINLVATLYAANYEPMCVSGIVEGIE
jgi:hypothetical protein